MASNKAIRVHWFTLTLHIPTITAWYLVCKYLPALFSDASISRTYGGKGLKHSTEGLCKAVLYHPGFLPEQTEFEGETINNVDTDQSYCVLDVPGVACDCLGFHDFYNLVDAVEDFGIRYRVTRLDVAIDGGEFSPKHLYDRVMRDEVVTWANRESVRFIDSPREAREDKTLGCQTVYIGSVNSERFIRCYNMRGYTRVECVFRGDWSDAVFRECFRREDWAVVMFGSIRQYCDFPKFKRWNDMFIGVPVGRYVSIAGAGDLTVARASKWLQTQVAGYLVEFHKSLPDFLPVIIRESKGNPKLAAVLAEFLNVSKDW